MLKELPVKYVSIGALGTAAVCMLVGGWGRGASRHAQLVGCCMHPSSQCILKGSFTMK
jgi:hypothetical protein